MVLYTALRNASDYLNATHVARWHSPGRLGDSTRGEHYVLVWIWSRNLVVS